MNGSMCIRASLLTCVLVAGLAAFAQAGWILEDMEGNEIILSNGKMKQTIPGGWFAADGETGKITYVLHGRKSYCRASIDDFCAMTKDLYDMMMSKVPAEQRKMIEELRKQQASRPAPEVKIVKEEDVATVAGLAADKYRVLADGELYEEHWVATEPSILKETRSLNAMVGRFTACMQATGLSTGADVTDSPEYLKMAAKGWTLRRVSYQYGSQEETEAMINAERKDVADAEFEPPSGYQAVAPIEFMKLQMQQESE